MIHNFMLDLFGMLTLTLGLLGVVISITTIKEVLSKSDLFKALLLVVTCETLAFMCLISMALTRCGIAFIL